MNHADYEEAEVGTAAQPVQRGIFIAIEGSDGSGKGTQSALLTERLQKEGYDVVKFDFPQYGSPSSYFVTEYLNGQFGSGDQVGPYTASLFFALDRYAASFKIKAALDAGKIVITNRFTGSNMAHQGTKFAHAEQRRGYFIWLDNLEFEMLKIPRPDHNFVMSVPAEIAQQLVDRKEQRDYTTLKRDIHENDLHHLTKSVEIYDDLCNLFPKDFTRVDCMRGDKLLSVEEIRRLLWEKIRPTLPPPGQTGPVRTPEADTAVPFVLKNDNGSYSITKAGRKWLENAVSNIDDDVYATLTKLESVTAAAAMARLSRRGDDMRVTILDEFAGEAEKDEKLLKRVISAYGDDSVQQLAGLHMVVENASAILMKKVEWGRLAAYLEQSTRYIYFDQKDEHGKYKYFVPEHFDAATSKMYRQSMDRMFDMYSCVVHQLTEYVIANSDTPQNERDVAWKGAVRAQACDAARAMLPQAMKATVGIFTSGQALENMIMNLLGDDLPEARVTGQKLLNEARKVIPAFLERADKPDRGGATIAYRANTRKAVRNLAEEYLPSGYGERAEPVTLTDVWPRNELDLVPEMLYAHSDRSLTDIRTETAGWPYEKKIEVFEAYMGERLNRRHKPGRAIEKAHYSWDIMCEFAAFKDLQRHRLVDAQEWQRLTPRYGYDIPKLVEDAGLSDDFEACFDESLKLYSQLQANGYELEAQYAVLHGHYMRWKVTYNAREAFHLHELRTSPQGHPAYRKLVSQMHDKLAEKHPLLAEAMKFVNQGEDEQLTRLAAERYTQFKLNQLQ
jgi:thymidylate kinase/thymidylate synthase ThyX